MATSAGIWESVERPAANRNREDVKGFRQAKAGSRAGRELVAAVADCARSLAGTTPQGTPSMKRIFKITAISAMVVLYVYGARISAKALELLPQSNETGPSGTAYQPWTVLHFASALVFAVLAMWQLFSALRGRYPLLHRYMGRIAVVTGLVVALSGASIPFAASPPRPLAERCYIVVYFVGAIFCLLAGLRAARHRNFRVHRVWMIRAVATFGAVVTQRVVFPLLLLTFGFHNDGQFWMEFVAAFALGWVINVAVAESYLRWATPTIQPGLAR
jgi:uncharacterized membrane protein YozB (DUF420 family)